MYCMELACRTLSGVKNMQCTCTRLIPLSAHIRFCKLPTAKSCAGWLCCLLAFQSVQKLWSSELKAICIPKIYWRCCLACHWFRKIAKNTDPLFDSSRWYLKLHLKLQKNAIPLFMLVLRIVLNRMPFPCSILHACISSWIHNCIRRYALSVVDSSCLNLELNFRIVLTGMHFLWLILLACM